MQSEIILFLIALQSVHKLLSGFDEVTRQIATQDSVKHFVNRIDHGKVLTKNALDTYTSATKMILKWCDSTTPALNQVINGNDDNKSISQLILLAPILKDGVQQMQTSQQEIIRSILNFNHVIGVIDRVLFRIAADFNKKTDEIKEKNRQFFENLENKIQYLDTDIDDLKLHLKLEVKTINSLEIQAAVTKGFLVFDEYPQLYDELRDDVLKSAERLNAECNGYRKRHE